MKDDLQLGKLKENCLLLKLYRKLRKMFLNPRRESNPQPSDLRWDALTIELPGLRWQREGHDMYLFVSATHVLLNSSLDMSVYLIIEYLYICMKDDLQLGKLKENCLLLKLYRKLRNMFVSPRWESNLQPSDLRWDALTIYY